TFNGSLEFTTTLNHGCTTIKNLDVPSTVLLNGKSYQRIADEPIHSDIHDLLNNVSLEENSRSEAMAQTNYVEHTEKNQDESMFDNQVSPQEQSVVSLDRYNEQIDSQDNQQVVNFRENIHKDQQGSSSQINDSENEIIDDNSKSSKEQSDDSLPLEKNSKPLHVEKLCTSSSEANSDEDESTSSDTNDITEEMQISTTINEIEKNKAQLLKNNFEIEQKNQLIVYANKLFLKNKSIEDLLITNFSHLFNDINVINFSFPPLPSYSLNMELLENYFKEWASQYGQLKSTKIEGVYLTLLVMLAEEYKQDKNKYPTHKTLCGFVKEKVKLILRISKRHEQRYWIDENQNN
ncbi:6785_t:CDS:10, partial [Dentiscutata erythropus]